MPQDADSWAARSLAGGGEGRRDQKRSREGRETERDREGQRERGGRQGRVGVYQALTPPRSRATHVTCALVRWAQCKREICRHEPGARGGRLGERRGEESEGGRGRGAEGRWEGGEGRGKERSRRGAVDSPGGDDDERLTPLRHQRHRCVRQEVRNGEIRSLTALGAGVK